MLSTFTTKFYRIKRENKKQLNIMEKLAQIIMRFGPHVCLQS